MGAQIGADEEDLLGTPRPVLLREVSGLEPEPDEEHVRLDHAGIKSIQRLRIGDVGGGISAAVWPAELQGQAAHLYSHGRAKRLVATAREGGWDVKASPHLAYFTSPPSRRLYLDIGFDVDLYIERWSGADSEMIGEHSAEEVRGSLWRWLGERGYVTDEDLGPRGEFLAFLGRRGAHLRPGLRMNRRWSRSEVEELSGRGELAATLRVAVNALLRAADEPVLPLRGLIRPEK